MDSIEHSEDGSKITKINGTLTKILLEIDGNDVVDITDLPKQDYEDFLELTHRLRLAYISVNEDRS